MVSQSEHKRQPQSAPRSWAELVAIEPRLIEIERLARGLPGDRDWRDWETIKSAFGLLLGDKAIRPELRAVECYNISYSFLLGVFERGQK